MFTYGLETQVVYLSMILSLIDVSLTYYTFFLDKKRINSYVHSEFSPLLRFIIRISDLKPWSYIPAALFPQVAIIFFCFYLQLYEFGFILFGAYFVITIVHYMNLKQIKNNWDNDNFWV